ncbi:hypothetical protein [Sorangium sp. So ce1389]|uniref:hypothetical protein n=1 Tax=Sorangium sp. So ce1389 TaxID=3133336 RepID=UPI003F627FA0
MSFSAQQELTWYFNSTPGARSNFGSFINLMMSGASGAVSDPEVLIDDELLDDVGRHRDIQRRLSHLPTRQIRVLRAALTYRQQHPQLSAALSEVTGLVLLDHEQRQLLSLVARRDPALLELRDQARKELKAALQAFQEVLRGR